MYDVTNPDSLRKVRDWVKELNKMLGTNNIRLAIIGNKIDLLTLGEQKCPQSNALIQEAMQFTNELMNARHYVTSAKLSQGISELFTSLSKRMVEQSKRLESSSRQVNRFAANRALRSISITDDDNSGQQDERLRRSNRNAYGSRVDLNNRPSASSSSSASTCGCWK